MACFQAGLNRDIQDRLEMQDYDDMDELLHKNILIDQQNKRKMFPRNPYIHLLSHPTQKKKVTLPNRKKNQKLMELAEMKKARTSESV